MKQIIHLTIICLIFISCKGFLQIDPPRDKIAPSQIFENDQTATSAMTGIYSRMASLGFASGDVNSIANLTALSSDELKSYSAALDFFYKVDLSSKTSQIGTIWNDAYNYIYTVNFLIEQLPKSNGVSEAVSKQLQGEAKFIRAFCYFYLINLYGDVPLITSTDFRVNDQAPRTAKNTIYDQIISDLTEAETLLTTSYVSTERIRPNKWAAVALLSRVYLYTEKWNEAINKATEVIDQKSTYSLVSDLDRVFLKNSTESIWQLMPPAGVNTLEGTLSILTATPGQVSLNESIPTEFEALDNRKSKWIKEFNNSAGKFFFAYKYKVANTSGSTLPVSEYSMVIRLAELHLIRAEARARINLNELALDDINLIRKRAGLTVPLTGLTSIQVVAEVEKQRRLELFCEWGHRWLDLKRTGRAAAVLSTLKGATWKDTDVLYPIPDVEISRNTNLTQNLGY